MINSDMLMKILPLLQSNPGSVASQYGFSIPQNQNSPQGIIEYLMNTGQINQNTYNNAIKTAQSLGYKL